MIRLSKRLAACLACTSVSALLSAGRHVAKSQGAEAYARAVLGDAGLVAYWRLDADFAYARLPEGAGDPELKKRAVERMTTYADHAIEFSRKNAYDIIAGTRTAFPLIFACKYFSTPAQGGFSLTYAYELTKKPAYLTAAVQGANYSLGANPDKLSYYTGVRYNAQHFNFIGDAQVTGQLPDIMIGHIPHGQGNEGNSMSRPMNSWVQQWLLNFGPTKKIVPNWYDWPLNEHYIDFGRYPLAQRELLQRHHGSRGVLLALSAYAAGDGSHRKMNSCRYH